MKNLLYALAAVIVIGTAATATPARADCWYNGVAWQCGHYYYPYRYYYGGQYHYYPHRWQHRHRGYPAYRYDHHRRHHRY